MARPIRGLCWDDNNVNHLWQSHQVTPEEVEDALLGVDGENADYFDRRVGEYLADGRLYIFSARDMNRTESRRYRRR